MPVREPDVQRVTLVAAGGVMGQEPLEAWEIVLDPSSEARPEELADAAIGVIAPAPYHYEEKREHTSWGADGPIVQEILVQYGPDVATGVAGAAVWQGLTALANKFRSGDREPDPEDGIYIREAASASDAWDVFERFLVRGFDVENAQSVEVKRSEAGWSIRGHGDGNLYSGTVSPDGRLLHAKVEPDAGPGSAS